MHRAPMIPSPDWKNYNDFSEAAGLSLGTVQGILCAVCTKNGSVDTPTQIVFVDGTSLCVNHI